MDRIDRIHRIDAAAVPLRRIGAGRATNAIAGDDSRRDLGRIGGGTKPLLSQSLGSELVVAKLARVR